MLERIFANLDFFFSCHIRLAYICVAILACCSGCATHVNLDKLNNGPIGSTYFTNIVGLSGIAATFEYDSRSGDLKVLHVEPLLYRGLYREFIIDFDIDNYDQYKSTGVIRGCVQTSSGKAKSCINHISNYKKSDVRQKLSIFDGDSKRAELIEEKVNEVLLSEYRSKCKVNDAEIGAWYSGDCVNGYAHGFGKAAGKGYYVGNFKNGMKHGHGKLIYHESVSSGKLNIFNITSNAHLMYVGDFNNDKITGQGTLTWKDKWPGTGEIEYKYVGHFMDGYRTGKGTLTYSDDTKNDVSAGVFLKNKLLTKDETHAYLMETDIEYAKNYNLEMYRSTFKTAYSTSDFQKFITQYQSNDVDGLVEQAKTKLSQAVKREAAEAKQRDLKEYRDSFSNAANSFDYNSFIHKYVKNDPDKLIPKAKKLKDEALNREKTEYNSIVKRAWFPEYKVKLTYKTESGKAISQLNNVIAAMKVRDPWGIKNPYWVPTFHASSAYDSDGIVIGEWYTSNYEGWDTWSHKLEAELKKLDVFSFKVSPLGNISQPQSNYKSTSRSPVDVVTVRPDVVAGILKSCMIETFSVENLNGNQGDSSPGYITSSHMASHINKGYNGKIAGNYKWHATYSCGAKYCGGNVSVSGQKNNINITFQEDCSSVRSYEN